MFDIDMCVGFITNRVSKKMADAFNDRLIPLGVTRVQWMALYYLGIDEGISQKELGEKMNIKDSTVARLIDRMEREDLVVRAKDPTDRRISSLNLSEKGKIMREELLIEGENMSEVFSRNITDEEMEVFKYVLNKMIDNIR